MTRFPLDINTDRIASIIKSWHGRCYLESRSNDFPFFTLGKSAYLDGNTDKYYYGAKEYNPILFYLFKDMYREVEGRLSKFFGEQVTTNLKLALPGFHIFPADPKLLTIAGNWHLDTPHTTLGLGEQDHHAFTVAIELPTGGGGIDMKDGGDSNRYIAYDTGELFIHNGMTPHRIASYREYVEGDYRITLQGHIIRDGANLIMFW